MLANYRGLGWCYPPPSSALADNANLGLDNSRYHAESSELNVDNWNDNWEAKSEAKSPRPSRGLQVDFSLTRNVSSAVR